MAIDYSLWDRQQLVTKMKELRQQERDITKEFNTAKTLALEPILYELETIRLCLQTVKS